MRGVSFAMLASGAAAVADIDLVQTPHGRRPRACVHQVPSGTLVESLGQDGVRHVFPNGTVRTMGPCPHAATAQKKLRTSPPGASSSYTVAHYPAPLYSRAATDAAVQRMTGRYIVPEAPKYQGDQSVYIWIGTDPDDESDVMQPVLGWNRVGGSDPSGQWYGTGGWGIESWNMVPSGHSTFSETIWGFQPGDVIEGLIQYDSSIGSNGYYIAATGSLGGQPVQAVLRAAGAKREHIPTVQFEMWGECVDDACAQVDCDRLPGSQVLVDQVTVEPASTFFSSKGLVWDLRERCGWSAQLDQPASGPTSWALAPPGQPTPTPSPPPTPAPGCADVGTASDCSYWQAQGDCASSSPYYDYMKENCCHTCGFGAVVV